MLINFCHSSRLDILLHALVCRTSPLDTLLESDALPEIHSANGLPSATLGKGYTAKKLSAKGSLLNVFCPALGKAFATC